MGALGEENLNNSISYKAFLNSPYKSMKHSTYFQVYDHLFSNYINSEITFVEIGVLSGGSLFFWQDFFGPDARIIGIDFNPAAKKWEKFGFEIFIGDQADRDLLTSIFKKIGSIDILLDDGGHTYLQQITTVESALPYINNGGMVVVEDTFTSYRKGFGQKKYSFMNYAIRKTHALNSNFNKLSKYNLQANSLTRDKYVWSVEFFQAIVAFRVNRMFVKLPWKDVINLGEDDNAIDYRFHNSRIKYLNISINKLSFLKHLPGSKIMLNIIMNLSLQRRVYDKKLKSFFN